VSTRATVSEVSDVDELAACGFEPENDEAEVVERVGVHGSSITFLGTGSTLYACDSVPDPITAEDRDRPYGGVWCGGSVGRLDTGRLNDPRLDLCSSSGGEITAFAWVQPGPNTAWVVVSDSGRREIYEVAESLPVRITTTDHVDPAGSAAFEVEEYGADGALLQEYTLDTRVAG
jgi:hypothetical protein